MISLRPVNQILAILVITAGGLVEAEEQPSLFSQNCAPCHGKDGKARTPMAKKLGVKDLTQSKIPDAEIERQIRDGRKDPQGKQLMPAFEEKLSTNQIKELISTVKAFRK